MEKFSELKYVRPDGEAYIQTIQKETKNFNEAADFEGAHQAFVAILNANSHFNTTRVMASIRNSQDTNDEFYRKEMEYIFEIEPQIDVEMKKFYESYLKSSYRTELEKSSEKFIPDRQRTKSGLPIRVMPICRSKRTNWFRSISRLQRHRLQIFMENSLGSMVC